MICYFELKYSFKSGDGKWWSNNETALTNQSTKSW